MKQPSKKPLLKPHLPFLSQPGSPGTLPPASGGAAACSRGKLPAADTEGSCAHAAAPPASHGCCSPWAAGRAEGAPRRGALGALLGAQLPALRSAGCPCPCDCTLRSHLARTRVQSPKPWESRGVGQGTEGQRAGGAAAKREVLLVGFTWGGWCSGGRSPSGSAVTSPTSAPSPATSPRQHPAKSSGQA